MSKFDELMTGRTAEQQAEADRRRAERAAAAGEEIPDLPPPPEEWEDRQEPKPASKLTDEEFVGYITAVIMPIIGVLVGCALMIKNSPRGASVVGWATAFWIIWSAVLGYGLSAGWFM